MGRFEFQPVDSRACARRMVAFPGMVTMDDFRKELNAQIERASRQGRPHIEVNAGELHRIVNPGGNRLPMACSALREIKTVVDTEVYAPPAGDGASFTVRYVLPR